MLKRLLKRICSTVVAAALSVSAFALSANAAYVDVPAITQQKSNWCWAACSYMSAIVACPAYCHNQSEIVYHTFGNYNNQSATIYQAAEGAYYGGCYYKSFTGTNSKLSFSQIVSKLSAGYPVQAGMYHYTAGSYDGGHMLEIYKAEIVGADYNIYYIDPSNGSRHVRDYELFVNDYVYTGYKYAETVYAN